MEERRDERYEACFRLSLLHNGRNLCLNEREMRALGYTDFNRRILYNRTEMGEYKPGWIERYSWKEHLPAALPFYVRKGSAFPKAHTNDPGGFAFAHAVKIDTG